MIIIKTAEEIELIARAIKIVTQCHQLLVQEVKPGITTLELDKLTENVFLIWEEFLHLRYRNYPSSLCASINEEVVHGIPSKRGLKDGDIIRLDVGAIVDGFYGDGQ